MLSKIYYGFGGTLIAIYLAANLLSLRSSGTPQPRDFGPMRMERGKYVYVPPTKYPSGSNPSSGSRSGGSSSSRSYPSSGGFSGGK